MKTKKLHSNFSRSLWLLLVIPFMLQGSGLRAQNPDLPESAAENLVLWLDANAIVANDGAEIETWVDKSSYNNDFTSIQEDRRPLLIKNGINGHQVVRFDGENDRLYIQRDYSEGLDMKVITMFAVYKSTPQTASYDPNDIDVIMEKALGTGDRNWWLAVNNNFTGTGNENGIDPGSLWFRTSSEGTFANTLYHNGTYNDGNAYLVSVVVPEAIDDAQSVMYINGEQLSPSITASTIDTSDDQRIKLGCGTNSDARDERWFDGDIAELIIYNRALSETERQAVEQMLQAKWFGPQTPEITTWPTASDITYGQPLSATNLTGGAADVNGVFSFKNPDVIPDAAGPFTAAVVFTPDDTDQWEIVEGEVNVTVTPLTIAVTAADKTKVYGEADPALTYTFDPALIGDDEFTGALSRVAGEDVGNYVIGQGTLALSDNYILAFTAGELLITELTIAVTAADKTKVYGEADPALTYTFDPELIGDDEFTGALSRVAGEDVGNYVIGQGTLALSDNYILAFTAGELVITELTIEVTAADKTKVYGEADPALTYSFDPALIGDDEFTGSLSREAGEDVGTYVIGQGTLALSDNYILAFTAGELLITELTIAVTAADKTKVYGEADPALTYSFDPALIGDDEFTGSLSREAGEDVGTYVIGQGTLALSNNYALTFTEGEFVITPKALTIAADDKTKYAGQSNPTFTVSYDGFAETEDESVLGGTLAFSTIADVNSCAGEYDITPSGLFSGNYDISFAHGILTINGVMIDASESSNPVALGSLAIVSATVVDEWLAPVEGVNVIFTLNYYDDNGVEQLQSVVAGQTASDGVVTIPGVAVPDVKVYKVTALVGNGCSESIAYLPVFDPSAGFVTGGGWINSPAGAYVDDISLVGKANFGFVAKYVKGRSDVTGNTEFQFKAGNLNFKSQFHESGSLVISGRRATYRGEGTINGVPGYKFVLVAIDGDWNGGTDPDEFRIRISSTNGTLVYDNGLGADENGDAATILGENGRGGGSIVIHDVKNTDKTKIQEVVSTENMMEEPMFDVYPNPFRDRLQFRFVAKKDAKVVLQLFDIQGSLIGTVFENSVKGGELHEFDYTPESIKPGVIIYRLIIGDEVRTGRIIHNR